MKSGPSYTIALLVSRSIEVRHRHPCIVSIKTELAGIDNEQTFFKFRKPNQD